jgi:hypothetical protein
MSKSGTMLFQQIEHELDGDVLRERWDYNDSN